jgi:glycosyltransferase involved in cell wall biosynthesis
VVEYLILASSFNRWAGPNNPLLDLCNYLYNDLDIDLRLVTHNASFQNDFLGWIRFPILPVLRSSRPHLMARLAYAPSNTKLIKKTIRSLKIPRGKIFVNASLDTLFETRLATNARIPAGYNVLSNNPNSIFFNVLDRLAAKTSIAKIMAHTDYHKRLYMKIGIDEKRIKIIPHCIDINRTKMMSRQSDERTKKKPIIFYGGRLTTEKGVKELLDSYQQLSRRFESTLTLLGTGPLGELIHAKKKNIENNYKRARVICFGWQPMNIFLKKMREADIIVMPSYDEPFGIILLEAMALNKPIVATCSGGVSEIITDHHDGILVAPRNSDQLTEAITELLNDSQLRKEIGSNAFRTVRHKYDVSKIASKFVGFMDAPD